MLKILILSTVEGSGAVYRRQQWLALVSASRDVILLCLSHKGIREQGLLRLPTQW